MYDLEYVSLLEVNHPDAVPADRYSRIAAFTTIPSVSTPTLSPSVMNPTTALIDDFRCLFFGYVSHYLTFIDASHCLSFSYDSH